MYPWDFALVRPLLVLTAGIGLLACQQARGDNAADPFPDFKCGYLAPRLDNLRAAVERGEIPDPADRSIPPIEPRSRQIQPGTLPCLSPAHIFPFEDSATRFC